MYWFIITALSNYTFTSFAPMAFDISIEDGKKVGAYSHQAVVLWDLMSIHQC